MNTNRITSGVSAATKATAFVIGFCCLLVLPHLSAQNITNLSETFTHTTFDAGSSAWTVGTATTVQQPSVYAYTPTLTAATLGNGNGSLSLNSVHTNEATYIYYNTAFTATNASVYATFQYASYGGTGADGISFFLFDASVMGTTGFTPGAFGGSLGYAQKSVAQGGDTTSAGLSGGYLGVGLDTYGNFANGGEGRVGGLVTYPTRVQDSVTVRGPAASGYNYLTSTGTLSPGLDYANNTTTSLSATVFNTVTISLSPTNQLSVYLQRAGSSTNSLLLTTDLSAYTRPDQLMFGFAAGTGGSTDNHLIRDLVVSTATASLWKGVNTTWGDLTNWNPGFVPSPNANILLDNSTVGSAQTIDVGTGQTRVIGSLSIDAPFSYTVDSTANNGTLEFQTTGASGIYLTATNGAAAIQTVKSSLKLDNDIEIKNSTTSALNIAGTVNTTDAIPISSSHPTQNHNLTLDGTGSGVTTLSGVISGAGSITKSDSGTAVLSGANTYSGGTTLNAGTLTVGSATALGSNTVVLNGGTLSSTAGQTINNILTLQGDASLSNITTSNTLTQTGGSYTLTMAGATQSGGVNISNNGTARTLTVQVDSGTSIIGGIIANGGGSTGGSLTKNGAGTLQLNAANSYTGTTTINNGNLQLGINNALNSGSALNIAGGTLSLNGFSDKVGSLSFSNGASIDFGSGSTTNTLVFGNVPAYSGVLTINNYTASNYLGSTTRGLATALLNSIYFSGSGSGSVEAGGTNAAGNGEGNAYEITPNTTFIVWNGANGNSNNWSATGNSNWVGNGVPSTNAASVQKLDFSGTTRLAPVMQGNYSANSIKFDSAAGAFNINESTKTLTLQGTLPSIIQQSTSAQSIGGGTIALAANSVIDISGTGSLTLSSALTGTSTIEQLSGTLILSGNNSGYSGAITVDAGTLQVSGSDNALGTGPTNLSSGATLRIADGRTLANALALSGTGNSSAGALDAAPGAGNTATVNGAITLGSDSTFQTESGTLAVTGGITGTNTDLTLTGAGNNTISSAIALTTGSVTLNGSGTTTFSGAANSYTGTTTVNSGTLVLGKAAGALSVNGNLVIGDGAGIAGSTVVQVATNSGTQIASSSTVTINSDGKLDLNGQSNTVAQLNSSSGTAQVALGAGTLTVGGNSNLNSSYAGTITGTGNLIKAGSGNLTLSSASPSFSGNTAINVGVITVSASTALGTGGTVTVASGANLQVTNGITLTNNLNLNGAGPASSGAVEATGGTNTLSGNITLQSNSRLQADVGATLNMTGNVSLGAFILNVGGNGNSNINAPGAFTGSGGLTKDGSGSLVLTGTTSYIGATAINGGTLRLGTGGNAMTGGSAVTIASGATFDVENGQAGNSIGALTANAGSTLTIGSGTLLTTGGTIAGGLSGSGTLQTSGTLTISSASGNVSFGSGTIVVNSGGVLNLASTDSSATFGTIILNGGTLNLGTGTGTGTYNITKLTVTGASTIDFGSGAVTLNGGTFSNPSGTLSIANWVNVVDYFFAQNWTGATLNVRNAPPENMVSFAASSSSYAASNTAWLPYGSTNMITPAPEPATYGAIFMGLSLVGLGFRRWRARRQP